MLTRALRPQVNRGKERGIRSSSCSVESLLRPRSRGFFRRGPSTGGTTHRPAGASLWLAPTTGWRRRRSARLPLLLVLGRGLGVDGVVVVAMSAGAAMIGSAFGPTNPFQAGIALKLAQLPALSGGGLRLALFLVAFAMWIGWTMRYAARNRIA